MISSRALECCINVTKHADSSFYMKRDLKRLARSEYDVLIIGGGIYGLFTAWDAALRGLKVALVEMRDFGHATSFNSLRVVHGGLRYLQHGHVRRMRQSICERTTFMRIAPHIVHPLPFLFPTYGYGMRGQNVFSLALMINDMIGFDRNRLDDHQKHLPAGKVVSSEECLSLAPGVDKEGLTGGAICYDAQLSSSERLIIAIAQSGFHAGVDLTNYVEVTGGLWEQGGLKGVEAKDCLTGETLDIRSRLVINTAGPWVNQVLGRVRQTASPNITSFTKAFNILVSRQLIPQYAVGVYSKKKYADAKAIINKGSRLYIITPWHEYSLIGTAHLPVQGEPKDLDVTEKEIQDFLSEINSAYPVAALTNEDIAWIYWGYLPSPESHGEEVQLAKDYRICDHEKEGGTKGLLSIVGVKLTESRYVAEQTVDLALQKLGRKPQKSQTSHTPVYGGDIADLSSYVKSETQQCSDSIHAGSVPSLVSRYGSQYPEVLSLVQHENSNSMVDPLDQILKAEVRYSIREESAQRLSDVIFRRLDWNNCDRSLQDRLEVCADVMGQELGWSSRKREEEVTTVQSTFRAKLMKSC